MQNLVSSQATISTLAPGGDHATLVIVEVVEYREGPVGPEFVAICDTPRAGIRKMTLPASFVEVSSIWEDVFVDYDRM